MDLPRTNSVATPPAYSSGGTPGYFSEAEKTKVSAQALNHVFRELLGILEGLGGTIDPENDQQIAPLLLARIAGATPENLTATKDGNIYSVTAQGPIARIICEGAVNTDLLIITKPPGAIPLSVSVAGSSEPVYARVADTGSTVTVGFSGIMVEATMCVTVIWGTAP